MPQRTLRQAIDKLVKSDNKRDLGRARTEVLTALDALLTEIDLTVGKRIPTELIDPLEELLSSVGSSMLFKERKYYIKDSEKFIRAYKRLRELIPILPQVEM